MQALAWFRDEYLCPCGCGFPAEVAHDPMTEFRVDVPDPIRCHVSTAIAAKQQDYTNRPESKPVGLLWSARVKRD